MMLARLMLLAAFALTSSAGLADEHEDASTKAADESKAEERACFNRRLVDSFDGLSDKHVFIEERGDNYFLLTMRSRCMGLENAMGIAIKDTMSRICANSFAEIVFRDMGRVQSCRIGEIERVENKEAAKALVAERQNHEKHEKKKKD